MEERRTMIEMNHPQISISQQCEILRVHRSGLYYQPTAESTENLAMMRLLDEQYFKTPFYGIRKLTEWLQNMDYAVNHKRVRRLMKLMGWKTLYREPNTSEPDKQHKVYPYLLKGRRIWKRNQVWQIDITYVPMRKGFMCHHRRPYPIRGKLGDQQHDVGGMVPTGRTGSNRAPWKA